MDFLTTKLKSRFRPNRKASPRVDPPSPTTTPPGDKQRRFSLFQPRVRTNFDSDVALGIIESPQHSPETPYSGVPKIGEVEIVTRIAKGEVTAIQVVKRNVSASKPKKLVKRQKSIDAGAMLALSENEARLDYSSLAGLLFTTVAPKVREEDFAGKGQTTLKLTKSQALRLKQAVAGDRELAYYRKRTMRETRLLDSYQQTLNAQLQPLESRFEATKTTGLGLTAEQMAIHKGIERIREEIAVADRERAMVEKRLGDARSDFEQFSQTALALLASLLEEQALADQDVAERKRSEDRFTKRYALPEGFAYFEASP